LLNHRIWQRGDHQGKRLPNKGAKKEKKMKTHEIKTFLLFVYHPLTSSVMQ